MTELLDFQEVNEMRKRLLAGENLTDEEMTEAVKAIRGGRVMAATTSKAKKVAAQPVDIAGMFQS